MVSTNEEARLGDVPRRQCPKGNNSSCLGLLQTKNGWVKGHFPRCVRMALVNISKLLAIIVFM